MALAIILSLSTEQSVKRASSESGEDIVVTWSWTAQMQASPNLVNLLVFWNRIVGQLGLHPGNYKANNEQLLPLCTPSANLLRNEADC